MTDEKTITLAKIEPHSVVMHEVVLYGAHTANSAIDGDSAYFRIASQFRARDAEIERLRAEIVVLRGEKL